MAPPSAVEQRALEDHVGAGAHRGQRLRLRRAQVGRGPRVPELHLHDRPAELAEAGDVPLLVVVASLADELELGVVAERLLELAAGTQLLERDQVVALEVADEIGGRDDERPVFVELHGFPL